MEKEKLNLLPKKPGCYLMKDKDNRILYVGKAKNLYNRVRSYFVGSHDAKTAKLVSLIYDFEYIITSTETEAFVLELNLIKKHRPKYNILLTDDKSYPYILLTEEKYPRLLYTRDLSKKGKYFGPYPNSKAAKDVVDRLNKVYPLRKCRTLPKKECLYYHIGQCLAPCIKPIDSSVYQAIRTNLTRILKGNAQEEIKELEQKMKEASDALAFEKALEYRNYIDDIKTLLDKQKMQMGLSNTDVIGHFVDRDKISIQVFHIRNDKMVERSGFLFEVFVSNEDTIVSFMEQFYYGNNNPIPNEILLSSIDRSMLPIDLQKKVTIPQKGKKKELVNLVTENAKERMEYLIRRETEKTERTTKAIETLGGILKIPTPIVIEAFDNSNIQGSSSVSAMVRYVHAIPDKTGYRKFKVKTVHGANDVKTMQEVISRRYTRIKEEKKEGPDLIVVDGGLPQVNAALEALKKLEIDIPVIGLAKNEKHKTEAIVYENQTIALDKKSGLYYFLETLQDEVHRYAITFHHQVHMRGAFETKLDQIPGIGPIRKKEILKILGEPDFTLKLNKLALNTEQKEAILSLYDVQDESEEEV